ncbi:Tyrocidine synthetase 1, partial [Pyrenophora tritici-repentis]
RTGLEHLFRDGRMGNVRITDERWYAIPPGLRWEATLEKIDILISTPSILSKYDQQRYPNIKTIAVAGEACPQALADDWAQGRNFYNLLGATETFLFSAHRHIPGETLFIGRPLPNTTCYILDDAGEPVSVGEKGTLWVGGAGVSKGYINLPLTTAEKFRLDKFTNDGSMMYNFGNIVCWRADGTLESFGRMDDQVKIKFGFRVELDGVTAVIEQFSGITRAASLVIDSVLYGFYASSTLLSNKSLTHMFEIQDVPLNPNGKVDKTQLKALAAEFPVSKPDVAPTRGAHTRHDSAFDTLVVPAKPVDTHSVVAEEVTRASSHDVDLEKGPQFNNIEERSSSGSDKPYELPITLPEVRGSPTQAWLRHRGLIAYRWFLLPVFLANIGVACWLLYDNIKRQEYPLSSTATATAANLCAAILVRSEPVINLLFTIFSSVPTWVPLGIRRICANVFHIGGIHVGCAMAAVIWFIIFTVGASLEIAKDVDVRILSLAPAILSYVIIVLLLAMTALSHPVLRSRYHDLWENLHRFGGWTVLILYWVLVGLSTKELSRGSGMSTSEAYLRNPSLWLIVIATCAIIFPWLFLRRVSVRPEVLSSHAIRLHFDSPMVPGKGVRLAQHPLRDWHGFATITNAPEGKGYSVIISRAGDFTGHIIDTAPTHIWRRGIPTSGVLRIATLLRAL